jgi:hypothetical protein
VCWRCYVTGKVIHAPVWVVFIAWASFLILGAGLRGLICSVPSNLTGIVIASLCVLIIQKADVGVGFTAVAVGIGSATIVEASRAGMLAAIPAIGWGFASTVGTVAVTGAASPTRSRSAIRCSLW